MKDPQIYVVLVTAPNEEAAVNISNTIVKKQLAACVNILPNIRSIFTWQGKVEDSAEHLLIIKTQAVRYKELEQAVVELHPYETPEVIALSVAEGVDAYCKWVIDET